MSGRCTRCGATLTSHSEREIRQWFGRHAAIYHPHERIDPTTELFAEGSQP